MTLKLNEPQNNLQLIQLENGFVVIDITGIGFTYNKPTYNSDGNIGKAENRYSKAIIFASQSFNLKGVKVIEEDIINVKKEAERCWIYKEYGFKEGYNPKRCIDGAIQKPKYINGFIEGYKQAKENTYTLEQVKEALRLATYKMSSDLLGSFEYDIERDKIINSLNQTKVEIFFDENNQPLTAKFI